MAVRSATRSVLCAFSTRFSSDFCETCFYFLANKFRDCRKINIVDVVEEKPVERHTHTNTHRHAHSARLLTTIKLRRGNVLARKRRQYSFGPALTAVESFVQFNRSTNGALSSARSTFNQFRVASLLFLLLSLLFIFLSWPVLLFSASSCASFFCRQSSCLLKLPLPPSFAAHLSVA